MIALHDATILIPVPPDQRVCIPESVTIEQSVAVVVRWLDRHPQSRHENFIKLAMAAMHETWPCDE